MVKILLLNGPPGCGKDTLGNMLCQKYDLGHLKFSRPLKDAAYALYSALQGDGDKHQMSQDYLETLGKDIPEEFFLGRTPRDAFIALSEKLLKPLHGQDIFGHLLVNQIEDWIDMGRTDFVVTDSGFDPEARVLVDRYGGQNVALVRLRRRGCSFVGDSRGYVDMPGMALFDIPNNGTKEDLLLHGSRVVNTLNSQYFWNWKCEEDDE